MRVRRSRSMVVIRFGFAAVLAVVGVVAGPDAMPAMAVAIGTGTNAHSPDGN